MAESDDYMSEVDSYYSEEDFFGSDEEEVENRPSPKKAKKVVTKTAPAKKAPAAKKVSTKAATSASTIAMDVDEDEEDAPVLLSSNAVNAGAKKSKKKTVEEMYQKKSQLEHILLRPDTYIGSVESVTQPMYVLNEQDRIVEREITFTPGLFKIFDEIVVNAADNKQRDSSMDMIDVVVDPEANQVSVKNNGKGIPIVLHKEHKIYVPTLIFGHLLTGSNFDDDEKKTTGGRNGYGAKLANVFSTEFIVECVDTGTGLKFRQVFRDNMTVAEEPTVRKLDSKEMKQGDYVKITFSPDLARFGMTHLDDDVVGLMSKRAYDIAGTMSPRGGKRLSVSLNGKKLAIKSFKDYLGMFDGINEPVAYAKFGDRWEVGVSASEDASMKQISFVNCICTSKGGGHVTYIADQVAKHLVAVIKKKNKGGAEVKPNQIKNHLTIFVNCLVENPAFDSQTKDFLTTRPKDFGTECLITAQFNKQIEKSNVVDTILSYAKHKQNLALKRRGGTKKSKLTGIVKLDDANLAGTAKSNNCTLIITEGDSAKSLAMSGLSVVGRDHYGVFPLKGKPLNVRDATHKAVINNEEIKNLVDIMGLKYGTQYDESSIKSLRYGHLMIMADQDTDGSHIKGLIINFIHNFWPSLLDVPGFLQQFITPIVKISKGKKQSRTFFNLPEYENWLESTGNHGKGWTIKYYKGLGTSTSAEAKEYFSDLDKHEVHFATLSSDKVDPLENDEMAEILPDSVVSGSDLIDMVFRKARVEDRKQWLNALTKDTYLDYSTSGSDGVKYSDFINREYVLFSSYDNERSIPHTIDGLKPSQRKVLFGCIKRNLLRAEIKVAQLVGYVAEHSAYHHGEASLQGCIVNMAQNFCGSNNINLLTPSGQFGTRRMGGKDSASPRYIFTKLETIARAIFHPDDDALLNYLNDDGASIEPDFYVPVIPMVLVNGADGIGTGWSTSVNNYDPRDIIANIRRKIAGEELKPLLPSYYGFTGEIIPETGKRAGSFICNGKIERTNDTTLVISELPIRKWTQDYKVFLEEMIAGNGKKAPEIKDFKENHTDTTVSFTITADKEQIDEYEKDKKGLPGKFKLVGTISTSNMVLFNTEARLVKYDTPEDIFATFYDLRLDYYDRRKNLMVANLRMDQRKLANKARFVEEVCEGNFIVSNRKRTQILRELNEKGYETFNKDGKAKDGAESPDEEEEAVDETSSDADLAKGYEYLLGMKIWSLSFEKAEELRAQLEEKTTTLTALEATSPSEIWLNDLDAIEVAMDEREAAMDEAVLDEKRAQKKNAKHQQAKKKTQKKSQNKKGKKKDAWDSEMEDDTDDAGDQFDEDSDIEVIAVAPKAKKPTARARTIKPPAIKPVIAKPSVKPAPAFMAAPKAVPKAATKPPKAGECDSDSDDEMLSASLMERMRTKLIVSPQGKKKPLSRTKMIQLDESLDASSVASVADSLAELDANTFAPASLTPATKKVTKKAATKKATVSTAGTKKVVARKGAAATKKVQKAIDLSDSDSDSDDFEFASGEENRVQKSSVAPARVGRNATKKRTTYVFSDDDEDGSFYNSD